MNKSLSLEHNSKAIMLILLLPMLIASNFSFIRTAAARTTWTVYPGTGSIQEAIDIANDGDTVLVLSGTYYEQLSISKRLSIIGEDQSNTVIDGNGAWTVVTISANNVTLKGFTIQHGEVGVTITYGKEGNTLIENKILYNDAWGIYGDRCGSNIIANNNVSFNGWDGIFLYASEPSVLDSNLVLSNTRAGVFIRYSSNNTITGNLVSGNDDGIYVYSDKDPIRPSGLAKNNVIASNHVLNNSCGIKIDHFATDLIPAKNEVYDNFIACNEVGLSVSGSSGNSIYHNNFIDNSRQVSTTEPFNNTWDDGYYGGGNYWSDHNSTDLFWSPSQNETGSDGIIDAPYLVSANPGEEDEYPFIYANGWLSTPEVSIVSPSNKTYRSNTLPLLATTNKPARLSYSLDSQTNLTIVKNLILSDLSTGMHNVTVHASDNLDNKASSEALFTITFLADINTDGTVNILDITVVALSFDSTPESERWNSIADLNNDAVINILDIFLVANEYGKTI